jgi:hypothetical protein
MRSMNRFHVSSLEIKTTSRAGSRGGETASHLLKQVDEDSILHSLLDDNIVHED